MASGENPAINQTQANLVDVATFVVLLLTLVAVAWYTWEAVVTIRLRREALEPSSRPYIRPIPDDHSIGIFIGQPVQIDVRLVNMGRRPTRVSSRGSVIYSESHLDNGSSKFANLPARFVWSGDSPDKQPHMIITTEKLVDDKVRTI